MTGPSLRLLGIDGAGSEIDALAAEHGGRVGLTGVLSDLNRRAERMQVPAVAAEYGLRWNQGDRETEKWYPQGIATSSEASPGSCADREVVVVAWYAKKSPASAASLGTRLSFIDVTDRARPRYRHVLLLHSVAPDRPGRGDWQRVRLHAGGLVWFGRTLLVADTRGGLRSFDLDDVIRVGGAGYEGYRYVLPQRTAYRAEFDQGFEPFRFSFVSLGHEDDQQVLLAGEYGKGGQTTRLVTFDFDPVGAGVRITDGQAHPLRLDLDGLEHMQGAVFVESILYISTSRGRYRRGTLWTRRRGEPAKEHRSTLAAGAEDLAYWQQHDQLWSCSEYPDKRFVYAMPRSAFPA